ncbi:cytochrome ubiquinol oxidase subunit I [Microtetraspora malaysiensis]|uniref:cytochrome ubiquinol oxidase subunit I n=1 Tax=Microtetraspora malaysiensis TaxID=161358 RepID=UPI000835B9D4|nr:cytochrome ubiquinol oxidase subunit I [Microtetraspora malaysiensis]
MDTLDLARLQFALTAGSHFLFVSLTIGLATLVAVVQTWATLTRSPVHERMTRFWGQLYVINYAMGIVTGLVMEFQIGLTWSGLTHFAGNVFGGALAMETLMAFFVESTFLAIWIFGWNRLNRWVHLAALWVVTITAYASAYWILVSNGFLQNPVGYRVVDGVLRLTDAAAVLTNPAAVRAFLHILCGSLVVAACFMAGVSAYHLRRRTGEQEFFRKSLRIGVSVTLPALVATASFGGVQFDLLQPTKLAAYQGDTEMMTRLQAEMTAAHGPGDYLPPTGLVMGGAIVMLLVFAVLLFMSMANFLLMMLPAAVRRFRLWHVLLTAMIPLPFVSMLAGWVFREVGRQPWVVYGLLTTEQALSDVSPAAVRLSLIAFGALFGVLIVLNTWLLARHARRGPDAVAIGRTSLPAEPAPVIAF